MKAWYFARANNRLAYGDNRAIILGKSHTIKDTPKLCNVGLHGSVKLLDALYYANSSLLYLVDITGKLDIGTDKICGKQRKYIAHIDATDILRAFARKQALINVELIKPYTTAENYSLILDYLNTGNEILLEAAGAAGAAGVAGAAGAAGGARAAGAAWAAAAGVAWEGGEAGAAAGEAAMAAANDML